MAVNCPFFAVMVTSFCSLISVDKTERLYIYLAALALTICRISFIFLIVLLTVHNVYI